MFLQLLSLFVIAHCNVYFRGDHFAYSEALSHELSSPLFRGACSIMPTEDSIQLTDVMSLGFIVVYL